MPLIDHLGIHCLTNEMESVVTAYTKLLATLGVVKVLKLPSCIGFGKAEDGEPELEIFRAEEDAR